MSFFDLSPEEWFRRCHGDVHERSIACYYSKDNDQCPSTCRYFISDDFDGHLPAIIGLDGAESSVPCSGGDDIDNSTIEAYCRDCVDARKPWECKESARFELKYKARREVNERRQAIVAKLRYELREFWIRPSVRKRLLTLT